jgi:hypothetical protein
LHLKAPAVVGCERPKQTGTSPKGHVDPDHAHELLNLVPGGPPKSIAIVNGGTDRRRLVVIALAPHLAGCEHDQVDRELSLKDTESPTRSSPCKPGQRDGRTSWQTSHERDLDHALAEVHIDLICQTEEERSRRESRKRRTTRYPTT